MIQWHTIQAPTTNLQLYLQLILNICSHQNMQKPADSVLTKNQEMSHKRHIKKRKSGSQSDQFQLEYHQIKKFGYEINKNKLTIGNWTPQENFTYLKFLIQNKPDFLTETQRRKNKVFYRLSKILKKRTPDQCRSHHQKLQMKFQDDIDEIIQNIRIKLEKKNSSLCEKLDLIQNLPKISKKQEKTTGVVKIQEPQGINQQFYKVFYCPGVLKLQVNLNNMASWS